MVETPSISRESSVSQVSQVSQSLSVYESQDSEWISSYRQRSDSNSAFHLSPSPAGLQKNGLQESYMHESFVELQKMHVSGVSIFGYESPQGRYSERKSASSESKS